MKANNYIAAAGCILLIAGQMTWGIIGMPQLYYWTDAVFKVMLLYSFSRLIKDASFAWFILFDFFFNLAVSNLIDELFFNPEEVQINEYACFMATAIIAIFRWLAYSTHLPMITLLKRIFYGTKQQRFGGEDGSDE